MSGGGNTVGGGKVSKGTRERGRQTTSRIKDTNKGGERERIRGKVETMIGKLRKKKKRAKRV